MLTEQTTFKNLLHSPASIQNTMNEHLPPHDLVDNPVRLKVDFPVAAHADTLKFR